MARRDYRARWKYGKSEGGRGYLKKSAKPVDSTVKIRTDCR